MKLWPLTEEHWHLYCYWHTYRKQPRPEKTDSVVFVGDDEPVMGVSMYTCDGRYMFIENFAVSPVIGKSEYKRATKLLISAIKGQASVRSRNLIVLCATRTIAMRLEKAGFRLGNSIPMLYSPWWEDAQINAPTGSQTSGSEETSETVVKPTTTDIVAPKKEPRKKVKRKVAGKSTT